MTMTIVNSIPGNVILTFVEHVEVIAHYLFLVIIIMIIIDVFVIVVIK